MAGVITSHAELVHLVAVVDDALNHGRTVERETLQTLRDFARDHLTATSCPLDRDRVGPLDDDPGPDPGGPLDGESPSSLDDGSPRARTRRSPGGVLPTGALDGDGR